jgi:hypothetical protein
MSIGNNHLYISTDAAGTCLLVLRISLQEIQNVGTIHINYANPSDSIVAYGGHLSQNTGDEVFWAGHNNTSQLRVFSWRDNTNTYFWRSIGINSRPNTDYASRCPDNTDWLNFFSWLSCERHTGG